MPLPGLRSLAASGVCGYRLQGGLRLHTQGWLLSWENSQWLNE
jgi:hypothetical protein